MGSREQRFENEARYYAEQIHILNHKMQTEYGYQWEAALQIATNAVLAAALDEVVTGLDSIAINRWGEL